MIPTAEEVLRELPPEYLWDEGYPREFHLVNTPNSWVEGAMIKFAKLHVEQALKAAAESLGYKAVHDPVAKESILTAYPPENIK